MEGHAAQQNVLLDCPGICRLVNPMKSSVPDQKLEMTVWDSTGAQYFACSQRELCSLCVLHQRHPLHGLRGGGATYQWASMSGLATSTTQRPMDLRSVSRTAHSRRDIPTPSQPALQRSCRPSPCPRRARTAVLCRKTKRVPPPAPAAAILKRRR